MLLWCHAHVVWNVVSIAFAEQTGCHDVDTAAHGLHVLFHKLERVAHVRNIIHYQHRPITDQLIALFDVLVYLRYVLPGLIISSFVVRSDSQAEHLSCAELFGDDGGWNQSASTDAYHVLYIMLFAYLSCDPFAAGVDEPPAVSAFTITHASTVSAI